MHRYLLLLLLLIASATGRLFHRVTPQATRPRMPPQEFSLNVTFMIPSMAQTQTTIYWQPQERCFRTNVKELVASGKTKDDVYNADVKQESRRHGILPTQKIYFPMLSPDKEYATWILKARAWTMETGLIDEPVDDVFRLYNVFAPFLVEVFSSRHWSDLKSTGTTTIEGMKLNGWRFPEDMLNESQATLFATNNGELKYLVAESPLLVTVMFKLESFDTLEDASICFPPEDVTKAQ